MLDLGVAKGRLVGGERDVAGGGETDPAGDGVTDDTEAFRRALVLNASVTNGALYLRSDATLWKFKGT